MPTVDMEPWPAAFCTCNTPSAELHSLLEDPQCLVLVEDGLIQSVSQFGCLSALCLTIPQADALGMSDPQHPHLVTPCSTSWYWLPKGILQLNCCRSLWD